MCTDRDRGRYRTRVEGRDRDQGHKANDFPADGPMGFWEATRVVMG